jgi:H2-forming N5,N10-methylenetetrahydromethanopterin dehydrogenase-like enzyme
VTRLKWKLVSVRLETVLISVQDRCILCAKCTIGSEVIFDTLDDILRDEAQMEARFGSFVDSANLDSR